METVQDYLRAGGTLESLQEGLAIRVREHRDSPCLYSFVYHQINTPKDNPVANTCRGIVLDKSRDWAVVCRPFDRFFAHDEPFAADIDWDNAQAFVKEDGSLLSMYHHAGSWQVSTKGTPDASGDVGPQPGSFAQLFWKVFDASGYQRPGPEHQDLTFIFELCTSSNRVVLRQPKPRLPLLGVRSRLDGMEFDPREFAALYTPVACHPATSVQDLLQALAELDPLHHEGFVVCDRHFRRVKVKHPGYFDLHQLKIQAKKPRTLLALLLKGEGVSFAEEFPEFKAALAPVQKLLVDLETELDMHYAQIRHIQDKKAFALAAQSSGARIPGILFRLRSAEMAGKAPSAKEILQSFSAPKLAKQLGLKTDEA